MKIKSEGDCVDSISSSDGSKFQSWENVSETIFVGDSDSFLATELETARVAQRNASIPRQGQIHLR